MYIITSLQTPWNYSYLLYGNISIDFNSRLNKINATGSDRSVTHPEPHPYLMFPSEFQLLYRLPLHERYAQLEDIACSGTASVLPSEKATLWFYNKLDHNP